MFETASPRWLTELRDRLSNGGLHLTQDECRRLASGFVGCNLVANLVDLVAGVTNGWPRSVFGAGCYGPPTCPDLRGWMQNPPQDWQPLHGLVGPEAAHAMCMGPYANDPWRQINCWLGIEAYLRRLALRRPAAGPPPSVRHHAEQTAESMIAGSGLTPPPCRARAAAVTGAWANWWSATVERLASLWVRHEWDQQESISPASLGALLARELGEVTLDGLAFLVGAKNNQLANCVQQLNQGSGGHSPVPHGWLNILAVQVVNARGSSEDITFEEGDLEHLRTLADWLPRAGLANLQARLQGVFIGFLGPPVVPGTYPNQHLGRVLEVLNQLQREIPVRGMPGGQLNDILVSDLIAHPQWLARPVEEGFEGWATYLESYYGIPRAP